MPSAAAPPSNDASKPALELLPNEQPQPLSKRAGGPSIARLPPLGFGVPAALTPPRLATAPPVAPPVPVLAPAAAPPALEPPLPLPPRLLPALPPAATPPV